MDEEGRPEGFAAVADIAEKDAGKQGAEGLDFRLAEMEQHEGDHLDEDGAFLEFGFQSKQQKAAVHIFDGEEADKINHEVVGEIEVLLLVVFLQGREK